MELLIACVSAVVFFFVNWGLLVFFSRAFKFAKKDARTGAIVSSISTAVVFVFALMAILIPTLAGSIVYAIASFIISAGIFVYLIKSYYSTKYGWAILVWAIIYGVNFLLGFLIGSLLALVVGIVRVPPV